MHAKAPDIPPYSKATQPTLGRSIRLAFQGARVAHSPHSVEEGDIYWANASLYTWANQSPIRVEGFTGQTPKPLNRPPSPHQNFIDFSKLSENSKNFTKYKDERLSGVGVLPRHAEMQVPRTSDVARKPPILITI
jgi:hypothetical protein